MPVSSSMKRKRKSASTLDTQVQGISNRSVKRRCTSHSSKRRGLPRPRTAISYSLPRQLQPRAAIPSTVSGPSESPVTNKTDKSNVSSNNEAPLLRLSRIKVLLDLIYRRGKNQHRNQSFWKWLSLLRRSVHRLVTVHQKAVDLESSNTTPSRLPKSSGSTTAILPEASSIRRHFELRSELRSQREVHEDWVRETIVPGCYVAFSTVVSDPQFANLGVVLMGVLADVVSVVGVMRRIEKIPAVPRMSEQRSINDSKMLSRINDVGSGGKSLRGISTLVTGPDQGEVVERVYDNGDGLAPGRATIDDGSNDEEGRDDSATDVGIVLPRNYGADGDKGTDTEMCNIQALPFTAIVPSPSTAESTQPPEKLPQHHIVSSPSHSHLHSPYLSTTPALPPSVKSTSHLHPTQQTNKDQPISSPTLLIPQTATNPVLFPRTTKEPKVKSSKSSLSSSNYKDNNDKDAVTTTTTTTVNTVVSEKVKPAFKPQEETKEKEEKKKRRRKRGGNAIDDLFGGLF